MSACRISRVTRKRFLFLSRAATQLFTLTVHGAQEILDRFQVVKEPLQPLAESENSRDKQMQELTTILQGLGTKQEFTVPTAESPALNLQEETPTGGEALVPNTAKETSDTSFSKIKEETKWINLPCGKKSKT